MADIITVATLRTAVRRRANIEGSGRFTDAELDLLLDKSAQLLYARIANAASDQYEVLNTNCTALGAGAIRADWAVPTNFWRLTGVNVSIGGTLYPVYKYNRNNRHDGQFATSGVVVPKYRLVGNTIHLTPGIAATPVLTVDYIPQPPHLTDTPPAIQFDGIAGFDRYIVIDACIEVLRKQDMTASTREFERDLERTWQVYIEPSLAPRDIGMPERMGDAGSRAEESLPFYTPWF